MRRYGTRNRRPRTIRAISTSLAIALLLSACSSDDQTSPSAEDDTDAPGAGASDDEQPNTDSNSLVLGGADNVVPGDWHTGGANLVGLILHNVVEPLLEMSEDGELQPLLVDSYDVSDDGREYTFSLKEGITFHDGSELTADDVIYSLETSKAAETSPATSVPLGPVETIERVDEYTVKVALSRPSQWFLLNMSRIPGMIIQEGSADDVAHERIGTGPYVIQELRQDDQVIFARFDDYWGEPPYFENVTYRILPDPNAQANAVLAGDVDVLARVEELDLIERVEEAGGFEPIVQDVGEEAFNVVIVNGENEKLDDVRVRQAIAYGINRQELNDALYDGLLTNICVAPDPAYGVRASDEFCPTEYDPDRARGLLAEAGAEDLQLELKTSVVEPRSLWFEILAAQLAEVGITLTARLLDAATWVEEVRNRADYDMSLILGAAIDVSLLVECPVVWTHECSPDEEGELLQRADEATDISEWADLRRQAAELQAERAYWIFVHQQPTYSLVRNGLTGLKPYRSFNEFDLRTLRWE